MSFSEKNIIKKIANDDLAAFEKLFKTYYEELCRFAAGYLKDMDYAEEIVQDVFYILWKNRKKMHIKKTIRTYLYTATKNKCLKIIRSKEYEEKYRAHKAHNKADPVSTPVDELNAKELKKLIEKTMESLPQKTRTIFRLSRDEGLKYQEIAAQLSVSVKTVEANMGKALKVFRKNLTEYKEPS
ncbi:MAG: RNA polymerase sigma-70 factor [Bacteroidales bacterium]